MKKRTAERLLALGLSAAMLMGTTVGVNASEQTGVAATPQEYDFDGVELTVWMPLMFNSSVTDYSETTIWKEVQERLGIKLNFITPAKGSEQEEFNLMIASGNLPDIIFTGWDTSSVLLSEGGDAYIENGIILALNDLVDEYMPNYKWALENIVTDETERKNFYSDNGNIFEILAISPYEEYAYQGIAVRYDLLEQVGYEKYDTLPQTIEDYEEAMVALKENGVEYPLYLPSNGIGTFDSSNGPGFAAAYGVGESFYQEDGTVKYGPIEEGFKEYLTQMNKWYEMGLIYPDFAAGDAEDMKAKWVSGSSAITVYSVETVNTWLTSAGIEGASAGPGYQAVLNEGDHVEIRNQNYQARFPFSALITTACENPEAAAAFLDYGYCQEGYMLYNYGIEGVTYDTAEDTLEYNGIEYTYGKWYDMIYGDSDANITLHGQLMEYKTHIGPFIRFEHESNPNMAKADNPNRDMRAWLTENAGTEKNLPNISLTEEESADSAKIMTNVEAYQTTAVLQFIMGQRSLDEFDDYVEEMKALGIEEAIEYRQAALERYEAR